jgi:hypothetical protein
VENQVVAEGWSGSWQRRSRILRQCSIEQLVLIDELTLSTRLNLHGIDGQAWSRRLGVRFRVSAWLTSSLVAALASSLVAAKRSGRRGCRARTDGPDLARTCMKLTGRHAGAGRAGAEPGGRAARCRS